MRSRQIGLPSQILVASVCCSVSSGASARVFLSAQATRSVRVLVEEGQARDGLRQGAETMLTR